MRRPAFIAVSAGVAAITLVTAVSASAATATKAKSHVMKGS